MNPQRRREINRLAEKVRATLGLTTPLDVERTVQLLGGKLITTGPDAAVEAYVAKQGEAFEIGVSNDTRPERRRFSIAHEIGHLFVHMGYLIDDAKWRSVEKYEDSVWFRYGYTEEEYDANEFAAALLMPESEFRQVAQQHRQGDTYQLELIAEHFHVSLEAALNRGRWLRIFSWE